MFFKYFYLKYYIHLFQYYISHCAVFIIYYYAQPNNAMCNKFYLHLHLVILQTVLSKATYNWGIYKAINLEEVNRQSKCP